MRDIKLYGTTDASGDLAVTGESVFGKLYAVEWIDGDLANGVDAVLSVADTASGVDLTLLTLTDANDDAMYYPRELTNTNAGGDNTADYDEAVVAGTLKLVVSSGGNAKSGGCIVYLS